MYNMQYFLLSFASFCCTNCDMFYIIWAMAPCSWIEWTK